ncbi:hypothetical protein [Streptomyces sp. SAS_270]|uniref:hypothetical protein n=1 Tax=Streptomyces sp. SAS_270 TaxID=3412748 RepID=UPI00403CB72B
MPAPSAGSHQAKLVVKSLAADPSLRLTESGRALLRLLMTRVVETKELDAFLDTVPPHCAGILAELAQDVAYTWSQFGRGLRDRIEQSSR